ncbi:uncharacterized protein HNR42_003553 [Deinobacterium chartae]|uniref:DUF177 domain-containing protein n=1 Tax=Deinobacterium chartae TaxID=521158 RepID=A0A841I6H2_9DEIO|nr:YceD family protein [Deinobacterium chartae]MBB6100088.1 uncharacterized protein [Deinobacterium chartae]
MPASNTPPILNLARLLRVQGETEVEGEFERLTYLRAGETAELVLATPGRYDVQVHTVGDDDFWLSGTLEATLTQDCARCLRPVEIPLELSLGVLMRYDPKVEAPYLDETPEGEELLMFGDPQLDLSAFFSESLLMGLPLIVLHDERCKGLCEVCGIDLNDDSGQTCPYLPGPCPRLERPQTREQEDGAARKNPFAGLASLDLPDE